MARGKTSGGRVLGIGLDLCSIERIAQTIAGSRGERFLARVFTARERAFCDERRDREAAYAARFAAKEAFVKALGVPKGISWLDVEILRGNGAPRFVLARRAQDVLAQRGAHAHLTLSHDAGVAAAVVLITTEAP